MNKKLCIRLISILLSLLLALSVPLSAYADADTADVPAETETVTETSADADGVSLEELEEIAAENGAVIMEGENGSDDLYLVEVEEEEEDALDEDAEPEDEDAAEDEILSEEDAEDDADLSEEDPEEVFDDAEETEPEEDALSADPEDAEDADEIVVDSDPEDELELFDQGEVDAAAAATVYTSGTCGTYARWELLYKENTSGGLDTWTLSITGSGAMTDYNFTYDSDTEVYQTTAPWKDYYFNKIVVGSQITSIGQCAFLGCTYATKATISKGVTSIGYGAFYNCTGLTSVSIPSTVKTIGGYAFCNCTSLSKITIPSSVTQIDNYALYSCLDVYYSKTASDWAGILNGDYVISSRTTVHYTKDIKNAKLTLARSSYAYTGKAIKPGVTVKYNSTTLKKGTDYTVSYKKNTKVGTATVTVKGKNNYHGSLSKTFKITKRSISKAKVSGVKKKGYTGKAIKLKLKVTIKIGSRTIKLKQGRDYTVKYKNNKKISTKKSKATVIITGKGNYKGTLKKSFKIVKGNPGLYFSKSKITKTSKSSFKVKAKKKVSAKLTLTYKSSNKKIATVNKKTGKVTPKKVGTVKITVTSKATKYYKAGKASYKVKIRPLKQTELNYWFSNYTASIPLSTFRIFFGSTEAKTYYRYYSYANGVCYGMSASSVMFNTAGSKLSIKNFRSSAKRIYDLDKGNTYKSSGITLQNMIEAMYVSQFCNNAQKIHNKHKGKLSGLVSSVRSGKPVMVLLWSGSGSGHAIVAYKATNFSGGTKLYVYDCNHPTDSNRCIYVYKSGGRYTSWYYDLGSESWSSSRGSISYMTSAEYKKIWRNRKGRSAISQMIISSDDFEIRNSEGDLVASMTAGEFSSTSDDIYMMVTAGDQPDAHLVYAPLDAYAIINTSADTVGLNVTALNTDQSITVSTESDTVFMDVDDEKGVNKATFEAAEGEAYEVSLLSDLPSAEGKEEITFSGIGTGSEVTLGTEDGACIIENAPDVSLEVNGEDVAYVVFDGEAVIDE